MITGNLVVGVFYTDSQGRLIKTTGFGPDGIRWYTYDCVDYGETMEEVAKKEWTSSGATDFPEYLTVDPRLPYVFDLNWDIKRVSELFTSDDCDEAIKLIRLMVGAGTLTLSPNPTPRSPLAKLTKILNKKVKIKVPKCKTPGAIYLTKIDVDGVSVGVTMPPGVSLNLTASEAKQLEDDMHAALENCLAKFFK